LGDKLTGNRDEDEEEERSYRAHIAREYERLHGGAVEERRGRGRKGPHTRGTPDPRLRESEVRSLVREALKIVMERKK
jgi:hypothetical protein